MEKIIKVLTLHQPYATLLAYGIKMNETRPSPTSHTAEKGTYLIHASKQWTKAQRELCKTEPFKSELEKIAWKVRSFRNLYPIDKIDFDVHVVNGNLVLPFGSIVGSFEVRECLTVTSVIDNFTLCKVDENTDYLTTYPELEFGDYSKGRSIWIGQNHKVLKEPIVYKGQQGYYAKFKGDINQLKFL